MMVEGRRPSGPWQGRVRWWGSTAFHPETVVVHAELAEPAAGVLEEAGLGPRGGPQPIVGGAFVRFGVDDPLAALDALARRGIAGQVDHVLFATCCCPPHPAFERPTRREDVPDPEDVKAYPVHGNPVHGNPVHGNPVHGNAGGGGCCCCGGARAYPVHGNPVHGNPVHGNPVHGNPVHGNGDPASGRRRSTARPADPPKGGGQRPGTAEGIHIAVLDTGWSVGRHEPTDLRPSVTGDATDTPTEDGDNFLDPAAGHGTFIAGILEQDAQGCRIEHIAVLGTYGDGLESDIADVLWELAGRPEDDRPRIVSLSLGGYTHLVMRVLEHAVAELIRQGVVVVASAGNDGTCAPLYPAALPGVIGVAATDDDGRPAPFSNYGSWVRACAPGVDVVSLFFRDFDGDEPPLATGDPDRFAGWARWSGTSFAAPRVAAAIARAMAAGADAETAVRDVVDEGAEWRHLMGTFVPRP